MKRHSKQKERPVRPIAADGIIINAGQVILVRRANEPFKGRWVLPGGMLEDGESLEETLVREMREETGLVVKPIAVVSAYSDPSRDPRKTISVAFLCEVKAGKIESSAEGKAKAFPIYKALEMDLGFDHNTVLRDGISKLVHTYIDTMLMEGLKRDAPVLHLKRKGSAFRRLVFVMLSARTKDEMTEKATNRLFSKYKTAKEMAKANLAELEKLIYGVGFYKTKAKKLKALAKHVAEKGIPKSLDELMQLPGVGRKTARVFLAEMGKAIVGADVHVHRISNRLGLVNTKTPKETEEKLSFLKPWERAHINLAMVTYGQTVCKAKPNCKLCPFKKFCAYFNGVNSKSPTTHSVRK